MELVERRRQHQGSSAGSIQDDDDDDLRYRDGALMTTPLLKHGSTTDRNTNSKDKNREACRKYILRLTLAWLRFTFHVVVVLFVWCGWMWNRLSRSCRILVVGLPMAVLFGPSSFRQLRLQVRLLLDLDPIRPNNAHAGTTSNSGGVGSTDSQDMFVSIVSHNSASTCASTLDSLFQQADHPEKITVGLVEQNADADTVFCLEEYCKVYYGITLYKRHCINSRFTKVVRLPNTTHSSGCRYLDRIHVVSTNAWAFHGREPARALLRPILQNQGYCLQVVPLSTFLPHWDSDLRRQWLVADNEFAILSHPAAGASPAVLGNEEERYLHYDCRLKLDECDDSDTRIPRWYQVKRQQQPPLLTSRKENTTIGKSIPVLGNFLSSDFMFSRCHLEETVPADPFLKSLDPSYEDSIRFARAWTRGYDVYTMSQQQQVVSHYHLPAVRSDASKNKIDCHSKTRISRESIEICFYEAKENRLRKASAIRASFFMSSQEAVSGRRLMQPPAVWSGGYGLGTRRSYDQWTDFAAMVISTRDIQSPTMSSQQQWAPCDFNSFALPSPPLKWVRYKHKTSPFENILENKSGEENPPPEFPRRTTSATIM